MKLTNGEMWDSIQVLSESAQTGKLGYACARNLRKLIDESREYMQKRDELLMTYGEDLGDGKFTIPADKQPAFSAALQEYAVIEHDVDVFQVSESVFCSGTFTTKEMFTLGWMVKEEGE